MLHEEVALYEKLTGQKANDVSVTKIGAYLDGYEKGLSVLEDIKAEIDKLPSELSYDGRRMIRKIRVFDIIDSHISGKENA